MSNTSKLFLIVMILVVLYGAFLMLGKQKPISELPPATQSGWAQYQNTEHHFSLSYPAEAQIITDHAQMAAVGYQPTCDPESGAACAYLPKTMYPNTNFDGAGVSVNILTDKTTSADCVATRQDMPEQAPSTGADQQPIGPAQTETINGISWTTYQAGDAAMSHQSSGKDLRTFHNGTCFEITTRINTTTFEVYQAGTIEKFTDANRTEVENTLDQIVMSFKFE